MSDSLGPKGPATASSDGALHDRGSEERPTLASFLAGVVAEQIPSGGREQLNNLLGTSLAPASGSSGLAVTALGRFHGTRTSDMLRYAEEVALTGALVFVEREDERVLYLQEGTLVGSSSTVLFEQLGRLLYQAEVVSHEASATLVDAEEALGAHALLLWISSRHLTWAIERRAWEVVSSLYLVKRGYFLVIDGQPKLDCPTVALAPQALAQEGARRNDEMKGGPAMTGTTYCPAAMAAPPPRVERELRPIDVQSDTLDEILARIREADATGA